MYFQFNYFNNNDILEIMCLIDVLDMKFVYGVFFCIY